MRRSRPLLGTYVEITADNSGIVEAGFAAVERKCGADGALDPKSELSRMNCLAHRQDVEVSAETFAVLERATHWWRSSGGVFDVVAAGERSLAEARIPRHSAQPHPAERIHLVMLDGQKVQLRGPST